MLKYKITTYYQIVQIIHTIQYPTKQKSYIIGEREKKRGNNNIDRVKININKQKRTSNLNTSLDSETV